MPLDKFDDSVRREKGLAQDIDSNGADVGDVLTADGSGGASWEEIVIPAPIIDVTYAELVALIGAGGIVEGNGRIEALVTMRRLGDEVPAGILSDEKDWYVPVLFGIDAKSENEAISYGIDHNNIVMLGGNFMPLDIAGIWDEKEYLNLIQSLDITPVSVDWESLNVLD